jgi:prepilin-type N-terminal cleavage/methylation domain-containing protein
MKRFCVHADREDGLTLAELMVAMALLSVLTTLVLAGVMAVHRATRYSDQDSVALGQLRTAVDRIEKEVRQARRVYSDSDAQLLRVWVDYDRDNQQDLSERITWELQSVDGEAHLVRLTDEPGSTERIVGRELVFEDVFEYDAASVEDTAVVSIALRADTLTNVEGPQARMMRTDVRLRNAEKE